MKYNYYAHNNFAKLKESTGYQNFDAYIYLGAYKHQSLLGRKFRIFIIKNMLSALYVEKDLAQTNPDKIQKIIEERKPFYFSGFSFEKSAGDLNSPQITTKGTFIIDLTQPVEKIWENFDYSLQKQIKKAQGMGLEVKKIDNPGDFKKYYDLLVSFRSVLGFKTLPFAEAKKLWQILHQSTIQDSCYEVFLCQDKDGRLLTGMGVMINPDEKIFIEVAAARAQYAVTNKFPDNDFLKWQIIQWGCQNGYKHYNLAGVALNPPTGSKEEGIYRFKKKWGGEFHSWYFYEKYFPENRWYYPLFYWIFKKLGIIKIS